MVYFQSGSTSEHKSFVVVSDTSLHSAGTVLSFLYEILPEVKALVPDLELCHYWTDSPTSQYRNILIFDTVVNHDSIFNRRAVWNYFEAGHSKGPCDGLRGTVKRMADNAVNTGKVWIQNASGFYAWVISSSLSNVTFKYVSDAQIAGKVSAMSKFADALKTAKGTMKIHAVVGAVIPQ